MGIRFKILLKELRAFVDSEDGQSMVEYLVLLSACIMGSAALARQIISVIDRGMLRLGGQLEKDLKVGRAPLNVWEN
jgi:Flp pilus assembly pilin Flp